jgi:hypothetical protein
VSVGKYIVAHWRGQQSLMRSCLFNAVVLGAAIWLAAVIIQLGFSWGYRHLVSPSDLFGPLMYFVFPFKIVVWLVWGLWAAVGVFRCGVRNAGKENNTKSVRVGGVAAITASIVLAAWIGNEVVDLVVAERWLSIAQGCVAEGSHGGWASPAARNGNRL